MSEHFVVYYFNNAVGQPHHCCFTESAGKTERAIKKTKPPAGLDCKPAGNNAHSVLQ